MRVLFVGDQEKAEPLKDRINDLDIIENPDTLIDTLMASNQYNVIVLDVTSHDIPGNIIKEIRDIRPETSIISIVVEDNIQKKIECLDAGANSCLSSSAETEELLAWIRNTSQNCDNNVCIVEDLTLYSDSRTLVCNNKSVRLSFKEFKIIEQLMRFFPKVFKKDELFKKAWREKEPENYVTSLQVYISFLRKKLLLLGSKMEIQTVRSAGYYLSPKNTAVFSIRSNSSKEKENERKPVHLP